MHNERSLQLTITTLPQHRYRHPRHEARPLPAQGEVPRAAVSPRQSLSVLHCCQQQRSQGPNRPIGNGCPRSSGGLVSSSATLCKRHLHSSGLPDERPPAEALVCCQHGSRPVTARQAKWHVPSHCPACCDSTINPLTSRMSARQLLSLLSKQPKTANQAPER